MNLIVPSFSDLDSENWSEKLIKSCSESVKVVSQYRLRSARLSLTYFCAQNFFTRLFNFQFWNFQIQLCIIFKSSAISVFWVNFISISWAAFLFYAELTGIQSQDMAQKLGSKVSQIRSANWCKFNLEIVGEIEVERLSSSMHKNCT
jgi:hypothetical protein